MFGTDAAANAFSTGLLVGGIAGGALGYALGWANGRLLGWREARKIIQEARREARSYGAHGDVQHLPNSFGGTS